ncbi:hypothetical protein [Candidatus Phytoplasma sacchari]|nr:hypothetical protein [Candidatus Phytoplasma sacchari]KAB8122886.1 hypothetical protein F2B49_00170 [Candidatus Phytoplasma sacchari]
MFNIKKNVTFLYLISLVLTSLLVINFFSSSPIYALKSEEEESEKIFENFAINDQNDRKRDILSKTLYDMKTKLKQTHKVSNSIIENFYTYLLSDKLGIQEWDENPRSRQDIFDAKFIKSEIDDYTIHTKSTVETDCQVMLEFAMKKLYDEANDNDDSNIKGLIDMIRGTDNKINYNSILKDSINTLYW